jgi:hypothetical protein
MFGNQVAATLLGIIFITPAAVRAADHFPQEIMGGWCALGDSAWSSRVDIGASSYEEGDGLCELRTIKTIPLTKTYEALLSCDIGVEGRKKFTSTELFSLITVSGAPHLLRSGSIGRRKELALYERCETTRDGLRGLRPAGRRLTGAQSLRVGTKR